MVIRGLDRISQNADLFVLVVRSYTVPLRHQTGEDERTVMTSEFSAFPPRVFLPRVSVKLSPQEVTPSDDPVDCYPH